MFEDEIEIQDHDEQQQQQQKYVTWLLITAYTFDRTAKVIFQFMLVIFFSSVLPNSLLLVSIYGLGSSMLAFLLGGKVGRFVDTGVANNQRLQTIFLVLFGECSCIVGCSSLCYILLMMGDRIGSDVDRYSGPTMTILFVIIILSGLANLCSEASAVSVEKDWMIVISGNDVNCLGSLNVKLRRVHLTSRMIVPALAAYCLKGFGDQLQWAFVAIWFMSILSFFVRWNCLKGICSMVPALVMECNNNTNEGSVVDEHLKLDEVQEERHCSSFSMINGYVIYFQQDIALAGLGESILYLNAMSSGEIMTSYLISSGLSLKWIGIVRGATAVSGLLGTIVFNWSLHKYSLRATAVASVAYMLACLSVSLCGTFFVTKSKVALAILVAGVTVSRIGLWANDLAIQQLTQHTVHEQVRGIVGGTQQSQNALFYALHFIGGLIWADPSQFYIICFISYSAIIVAFLLMLRCLYFSSAFKTKFAI